MGAKVVDLVLLACVATGFGGLDRVAAFLCSLTPGSLIVLVAWRFLDRDWLAL